MKALDIWIKAKEIAERVEQETTLLALIYLKRGQSQIYDNIVMDADTLLIFRTYFKEASEKVRDKCLAYSKYNRTEKGEDDNNITQLDEDFFLTLHLPDNFPNIIASGIDRAIFAYLTFFVIYRWLETKLPQEALLFKTRSDQNLIDLSSRLEIRYKPLKRPYRLY